MAICYLDANVLVYFKDTRSPHFSKAKRLIKKLLDNDYQLAVSPLVLDEFFYVTRYVLANQAKLSQAQLYQRLNSILEEIFRLPSLSIVVTPATPTHQRQVVRLMEQFNLQPRDAYHIMTLLANKVACLATFDKGFDKLFRQGIIKKPKV